MNSTAGQLLVEARQGAQQSLDTLLELYRQYLHSMARQRLGANLRGRVNASDVVQEAMLQAWLHFDQFQGQDGHQFVGWLRRILVNCLGRVVEQQMGTRKRDVRREVSLEQTMVTRGPRGVNQLPAAADSTPSTQAARHELTAVVAQRLYQLPPQYRDVIVLRNLENLDFDEVARRMQRTSGAVRILWLRALEHLRKSGVLEGLA